jgi:hypothetical protein
MNNPQDLCGECGLVLSALDDGDRSPCPNCGGHARMLQASSHLADSSTLGVCSTLIHMLDSACKYYSEILKAEYDEYFAAPATLRSAFNLAKNLFHFHDWLFEDHRKELEAHFGMQLAHPATFWAGVEKIDNRFGFIRDLANASKHVRLTHRPSTSMTHIANTFIEVGAFDSAAFDRSVFDTTRVKMKDGTVDVDFDDCARALFRYWTDLLQRIRVSV